MKTPEQTALAQHLLRCPICGHLCKLVNRRHARLCPLCGEPLHVRRPHSLQQTWALLLSSYVLYIPANIFPIMTVTQLGMTERHTIIGGIIALVEKDMAPIAVLVFIASIVVPLLKLIGLSLLLLNVQLRWQARPHLWMRIYRLIVFVGRWSMLDIFMISILVAVVDLSGGVSQVIAGSAATAFAAVVVLTMLAAKSFDPRLIWDKQHKL
jgi:paraquat-inducible protein A